MRCKASLSSLFVQTNLGIFAQKYLCDSEDNYLDTCYIGTFYITDVQCPLPRIKGCITPFVSKLSIYLCIKEHDLMSTFLLLGDNLLVSTNVTSVTRGF